MKRRVVCAWLGLAGVPAGCGYRSLHTGAAPSGLHLGPARTLVPYPEALQAILGGVRAELSRAGALQAGRGSPSVSVELLRVDQHGAGIADLAGEPLARGLSVGVVGRAWVDRDPGAPAGSGSPSGEGAPAASRLLDTGDLRRVQPFASGRSNIGDELAFTAALRAASERLGRDLARSILGEPVPPAELL